MKTFIGVVICLLSVVVGLYVGLYLCLFGGIVQVGTEVKDAINHEDVSVSNVAFGIIRIMAAGLCGWLTIIFGWAIGVGFLESGSRYSRRW